MKVSSLPDKITLPDGDELPYKVSCRSDGMFEKEKARAIGAKVRVVRLQYTKLSGSLDLHGKPYPTESVWIYSNVPLN
jgi:hypothetical protein